MKEQKTMWTGLIVLAMLSVQGLAGCGGEDATVPAGRSGSSAAAEQQRPVGEFVVEPSATTLVIDGEPSEALALVRELVLADGQSLTPEGYTLRIDEAYESKTRLCLVVEPTDKQDEQAIKDAAGLAYEALAGRFAQRSEAALRDELIATKRRFDETSVLRQSAQEAVRAYSASRSGLDATKESRLQTRRLELQLEQALDEQTKLEKQVQSLQKQIDRQRWVTLVRVR